MYSTSSSRNHPTLGRYRTDATLADDGSVSYTVTKLPTSPGATSEELVNFTLPAGFLGSVLADFKTLANMEARRVALQRGDDPGTLPPRWKFRADSSPSVCGDSEDEELGYGD